MSPLRAGFLQLQFQSVDFVDGFRDWSWLFSVLIAPGKIRHHLGSAQDSQGAHLGAYLHFGKEEPSIHAGFKTFYECHPPANMHKALPLFI